MKGWGIEEQGELWPVAYETVQDAAKELAERVCELCNMPDKAKGSDMEWTFRIVRVKVDRAEK